MPRTLTDYYPGKGCTCAAKSSSECCCDVDWSEKTDWQKVEDGVPQDDRDVLLVDEYGRLYLGYYELGNFRCALQSYGCTEMSGILFWAEAPDIPKCDYICPLTGEKQKDCEECGLLMLLSSNESRIRMPCKM